MAAAPTSRGCRNSPIPSPSWRGSRGWKCITARAIGVSKGTADTQDDLIFQLGLSKNSQVIDGKSKRIMEAWKRDINNATRDIKKALQDLGQGQEGAGGNSYEARTQMRGKQTRLLDDIIAKLKRFEEAFGPRWHGVNQVPPIQQFELRREEIGLQQLVDKK